MKVFRMINLHTLSPVLNIDIDYGAIIHYTKSYRGFAVRNIHIQTVNDFVSIITKDKTQ